MLTVESVLVVFYLSRHKDTLSSHTTPFSSTQSCQEAASKIRKQVQAGTRNKVWTFCVPPYVKVVPPKNHER